MKNEVCVSGYVGSSGECNDCGSLDCRLARPAKMTSELRADLELQPCGPEALRIIDQLTAALEAAESTNKALRNELSRDMQVSAESRAESLQTRVAELEAEDAEMVGIEAARADRAEVRAHAAEAELADLRGRVERALKVLDSPGSGISRVSDAATFLRGGTPRGR